MMTLTILVCLVLFIAAFVRSSIGFGDSLLAMSVLPLCLHVKTATPLVALTATTIGLGILWHSWRQVDVTAVWRLVLSSVAGIPVGLYILKSVPEATVKNILGLFLIGFASYSLLRPRGPQLKNTRWSYVAGFIAGVLGGAYNTNGPPVVVYASLCRWSPERFVATMQGYFLPTGLFIVIGHGLADLWTPQLFHLYGWSFPGILLAVALGTRLQRRIKPGTFDNIIYVFLLVMGGVLVFA